MEDLTVRMVDSADDIEPAAWRMLSAGHGLYTSPRWLRSLEDDPRYDQWYATARAGGEVVGILPAYLPTGSVHGVDAFIDPVSVFGWRPAVIAGGRSGYEVELLLSPRLSTCERAKVLRALVGRVRRLATGWGMDAVALLYLTPGAATELAAAVEASPLLTDLSASVSLAGCATFDDYLGRLSGHRSRRLRREIREFDRAGFTIRPAELADSAAVMAPLLATHHARYGMAYTAEMFSTHLATQWDDASQVLLCERLGTPVGTLLLYEWGDTWYARAVGITDELRTVYFNLVYYEPIRRAIARGIERYVVGPGTLEAKVRRGAELEPRWSILLGPDTERLSATWNEDRRASFRAELEPLGVSSTW